MTQNARLPHWIIGDKARPGQLNELSTAIEDASRFTPVIGHSSPSYMGSAVPETEFFLVKILGNDGGNNPEGVVKHIFEEVVLDTSTNKFVVKDGGANSSGDTSKLILGFLDDSANASSIPPINNNLNNPISSSLNTSLNNPLFYVEPLVEASGATLLAGTVVFARKGAEGVYVAASTGVSSSSSSKRLIWFTEYLHVENVQVTPGQVISNNQYIADIAAQTDQADFGGDSHLHWGLGDGIKYFYPDNSTLYLSNVGQTVDMVNWFNTEYDFLIATDHLLTVLDPNELQFTSGQVQEIKLRTRPPVVDDTTMMWQSSGEHYGYEYFAIDFAKSLVFSPGIDSNPTDAGTPVFNTILSDVEDVVSTVMFVQNIDIDIDPSIAGRNVGWIVIVKHEIIDNKEPDEIPLIGLWSKPAVGFPTYEGYVSHLQFHENYPISRVGSFAHIGVPSSIPSGSECWTAYNFTLDVDVNNANASALLWWRISRSTSPDNIDITGILARSDGCPLLITHIGNVASPLHPFRITLKYESTLSTAANRIYSTEPYAEDFILWENQSVLLRYDFSILRWRIVSVGEGIFTGATSSVVGTSGLVLDPEAGDDIKYLRGNSSWDDPSCWEAFDGAIDTLENNYDPDRAKWWRLTRGSSPADASISGIQSRDDGCPILITHYGNTGGGSTPNTITLLYEDSNSSASNRIRNSDGSTDDIVLYSFESVLLRYDDNLNRWRVIYPRIFKGSSGGASLGPGWVPKATPADFNKFLKGNGLWGVPDTTPPFVLTVEEYGSSPTPQQTITNVDIIRFKDSHDDNSYTIVSPSAGVVEYEPRRASYFQSGYVDADSIHPQTLGYGTKGIFGRLGVGFDVETNAFSGNIVEDLFFEVRNGQVGFIQCSPIFFGTNSDAVSLPPNTLNFSKILAGSSTGFTGPYTRIIVQIPFNQLQAVSVKITDYGIDTQTGSFNISGPTTGRGVTPNYSVNGIQGVTGSMSDGLVVKGGIVIGLGTPPPPPTKLTTLSPTTITPGVISGTSSYSEVAEMSFNAFPSSGTQTEFVEQPAGYMFDSYLVEITEPFTKSFPGSITLDLGTVAVPNTYIANGDLTQARGSFILSNAVSMGSALNSITQSTSLKARVNYTTGSLTSGAFKVRLRYVYTGPVGYPSSSQLTSVSYGSPDYLDYNYDGYASVSRGGPF